MVFSRRNRHRQSQHSIAKSVGKGFALLVSILILSCSQEPKKFTPAPSLQTMGSSSGLKLTSIGKNLRGRFSPDGQRVLFISSHRESHLNAQLYELSLDTFRERRVTYHDGDCLEADYSPDGRKIIYASTTDELKEHPVLLKPKRSQRAPTELYMSDPRGMQIERLTRHEGYQGQIAWVSDRMFLFASENKDRVQIDSFAFPGDKISVWQNDPQSDLMNPAVDSTGKRAAWVIEKPGSPPRLGFKLMGKVKILPLPFEQVQSLQWINGNKNEKPRLLASARKGQDKFLGAWVLDPEQDCAISLLQESGHLKDLRVSNSQEKLLFTFEFGENSQQIYLREFPPISNNCEPLTRQEAPKESVPQTPVSTKPAADPQEHPKTQSNSEASKP